MIGFRKLDALGEECSQRVLIGGIILGSELKEDEASSSKGLCPAMAKDSFRRSTFLRKFSRIPFGVTPKVILVAWESFGKTKDALKDKQYRQEDIQELMSKLLENVRNISEEFLEYINCPSWNHDTCDVPVRDNSSTFDDTLSDDDDFEDVEYVSLEELTLLTIRASSLLLPFPIPSWIVYAFLDESRYFSVSFDKFFTQVETSSDHHERDEKVAVPLRMPNYLSSRDYPDFEDSRAYEEGGEQDVDLDALLALANAAVIVDSNIPPGVLSEKEKAKIARQDAIYAKQLEQEVEMSASQRETIQRNEDLPSVKAILFDVGLIDMQAFSFELFGVLYLMMIILLRVSTTIYSTGWSMKYVKSLTDEQLIAEPLQRSKKQKSTEAPIPSVPDVPQPKVVSSSKSFGTRRKSLGRSRITKPELDLDADDKTFLKVVSDEDSEDEAPILWSAFAGWEDLLKLYGLVVKYYEKHPVTGARLMLWGDLQVLMDSQEGGKGYSVWHHQSLWQINSWRLYTLSNVHVLETVSGKVLYMFADVSYPLSVKLMERMLKYKLEIDKDVVGNDMTTAGQLIRFIKNQLAAAQVSPA
ncbi:hypothetical protein Tco_1304033 [Tanacetum coccineum]